MTDAASRRDHLLKLVVQNEARAARCFEQRQFEDAAAFRELAATFLEMAEEVGADG